MIKQCIKKRLWTFTFSTVSGVYTLGPLLNKAGNGNGRGKDRERKKRRGMKSRNAELAREICATAAGGYRRNSGDEWPMEGGKLSPELLDQWTPGQVNPGQMNPGQVNPRTNEPPDKWPWTCSTAGERDNVCRHGGVHYFNAVDHRNNNCRHSNVALCNK